MPASCMLSKIAKKSQFFFSKERYDFHDYLSIMTNEMLLNDVKQTQIQVLKLRKAENFHYKYYMMFSLHYIKKQNLGF